MVDESGRPRCEELFPEIYQACEALPSADVEKRKEAADALCLAHLLLGLRPKGLPELWSIEAELLATQAR